MNMDRMNHYARYPGERPPGTPRAAGILLDQTVRQSGPDRDAGVAWLLSTAAEMMDERTLRVLMDHETAKAVMVLASSGRMRRAPGPVEWLARETAYVEFDKALSYGDGVAHIRTMHGILMRGEPGQERDVLLMTEAYGKLGATAYRYNARWQRISRIAGESPTRQIRQAMTDTMTALLGTLNNRRYRLEPMEGPGLSWMQPRLAEDD